MEKRMKRYNNLIVGSVMAVFLILTVMAIHDMQVAEGVGLYFALKAGKDRLLDDVVVDVLAAMGFLGLICLPGLFLKHRSLSSCLRCMLIFLSLMPSLSMAYLLRPLQAEGEVFPQQFVAVTGTTIPVLCLLGGVVMLHKKMWKTWYGISCAAAALLFVVTLFVPSLQQLFYFILAYLLVLICYDLCECLYLKYPAMNTWGKILFGGLAFRAFYVLSMIMWKY